LLRADDVWFAYRDTPVLRDVSLEIEPGAFVGILGPNGSGKTTLLKVLGGLAAPGRGHVFLDGRDLRLTSRTIAARRIATVPQETHLAFDYSVLEIALMGRYPYLGAFQLEGPEDIRIARAALAATGTLHLEERSLATLSGGEKQRVIIASALAQVSGGATGEAAAAPLLLLDEPTASLDVGYQLDIADMLRTLNRERGITMVLSTHDLNLAAGVCRELVLLRDGEILATGPTETVLTAEAVRALYDTEADVRWHDDAGHLTVVPLRR
jgi:iron complex transport system ATP-binding protein